MYLDFLLWWAGFLFSPLLSCFVLYGCWDWEGTAGTGLGPPAGRERGGPRAALPPVLAWLSSRAEQHESGTSVRRRAHHRASLQRPRAWTVGGIPQELWGRGARQVTLAFSYSTDKVRLFFTSHHQSSHILSWPQLCGSSLHFFQCRVNYFK